MEPQWIDWRRLEAVIPLDELPALHRAFLERVRPGEADWSTAFLRQVQGKVQATLKQLQRDGRAKLEGDTLLVSLEVLPAGFAHYLSETAPNAEHGADANPDTSPDATSDASPDA